MAENKDSQAAFMEAVGSIKEYAKVSCFILKNVALSTKRSEPK